MFISDDFTYGFIRVLLTMTLTGGVLSVIYMLVMPAARRRLPPAALYRLWLVALAAFVVPVSLFIALPSFRDSKPPAPIYGAVEYVIMPQIVTVNPPAPVLLFETTPPAPGDYITAPEGAANLPPAQHTHAPITPAAVFIYIYPVIALCIFLYMTAAYAYFIRRLRRSYRPAGDREQSVLANLIYTGYAGILPAHRSRVPALYRSSFISTPMLIGLFKPVIILPNRAYTDIQLRNILLHELTHMRRLDIAVKWLASAAAVHWFNPAVWLLRREINRACELSCDEAVIRSLDGEGKRIYGETLIDTAAFCKAPAAAFMTTLCEDKKTLKERLAAIKNGRKPTRAVSVLSALFLVTAVCAACALGASGGGAGEETETIDPAINKNSKDEFTEKIYDEIFGTQDAQRRVEESIIQQHEEVIDAMVTKITPSPYAEDTAEEQPPSDTISPGYAEILGGDYDWLIMDPQAAANAGLPATDTDTWVRIKKGGIPGYGTRDINLNEGEKLGYSDVDMLAVRTEPSFSSAKLDINTNPLHIPAYLTLGEGHPVIITEELDSGWLKIRLSGYEYTGYVHGSLVQYSNISEDMDLELGYVIAPGMLNFRKDPSLEAKIITQLHTGTPLEITGFYNDVWAAVNYNGESGYVMAMYISSVPPNNLFPPVSTATGYITDFDAERSVITFKEVKWLTEEDEQALEVLGIDPASLPNGFYIQEFPLASPLVFVYGGSAEFNVINYTEEGVPSGHKTIPAAEFAEYLVEYDAVYQTQFLCDIEWESGTVRVTERYRP